LSCLAKHYPVGWLRHVPVLVQNEVKVKLGCKQYVILNQNWCCVPWPLMYDLECMWAMTLNMWPLFLNCVNLDLDHMWTMTVTICEHLPEMVFCVWSYLRHVTTVRWLLYILKKHLCTCCIFFVFACVYKYFCSIFFKVAIIKL